MLLSALTAAIAATGCFDSDTGSQSNVQFADTGSQDADNSDVQSATDTSSSADIATPDALADVPEWETIDAGGELPDLDDELTIGPADRPARILLPDDYDGSTELPVIFLFHGYTATSGLQDLYFGLSEERHDRKFILILADGLVDSAGQQYWNATDFCCDIYDEEPDDVGYFETLLDEVLDDFAADPDQVHLMGHSNGHFFSNRLACDMGSRLTSVVGLAGSGHYDADDCPEDGQVSMLHIHGTADAVIYYGGLIGSYPSARAMTDRWSERNDCSGSSSIDGSTSIDSAIFGSETTQRRYEDCPAGIDVELWSIVGGSHTPALSSSFSDQVLDFALTRTNPDATTQ